jgi:hypothetical protein
MKKEYHYYHLGIWNVDKNQKRILSVTRSESWSFMPGPKEYNLSAIQLLKYECLNENYLLFFVEEARRKLGKKLTKEMISSFVKRTIDDFDLRIPNIKFESI